MRRQSDLRWCGREIRMALEQASLEVQDVFTQLVILSLQHAEILLHGLKLLDLLLELLDVALLALTERTL